MDRSGDRYREGRPLVKVVKCGSYDVDRLTASIRDAVSSLGGMEAFVSPGQRVLLKPNLLSAKGPERAITTHPNLVEAVASLVREAGGVPVVGDSPGGAIRGIERVWKNTGLQEMAERAGIELVNFEASGLEEVSYAGYRLFIARPVLEADVIINLPKLKTHTLTLLTCAVKNMFGVVPGFRKAEYHKEYPKPEEFAGMLAAIYGYVRPALTIVDGVLSMEGNGPSGGDARETGLIMAGTDGVAVDSVAAALIGFGEGAVDSTRIAHERGLGEARLDRIEVVGEGREAGPKEFVLPSNRGIRLIPRPLAKMVAPFVWLKLEIDPERCTRCEFCLKSCPVKTIRHTGGKVTIDQSGCIQCMCCHELCPEKAIDIRMSLLAKLFA